MNSHWSVGALIAYGLLTFSACSSEVFECVGDSQCGDSGVCEPNGYCSFPSPDCPSGRKYGQLSSSGVAGQCVVSQTGTTSGTEGSTNADDSTSTNGSTSTSGATNTGMADEGPAKPMCGDGVVEGDEECDQGDANGVGFCTDQCAIDECGDGYVGEEAKVGKDPEVCDGQNLRGQTCESQGFNDGSLSCLADCTGFDLSDCVGGGSSTTDTDGSTSSGGGSTSG